MALEGAEMPLKALSELLSGNTEAERQIADLEAITEAVGSAATVPFKLKYDPTLVRGMSYYTGPIFELELEGFGGSSGGGGRYDEMVGKFTGQKVPACGISIGFERLILILTESGFTVPGSGSKKAYLLEKNLPAKEAAKIRLKAAKERAGGRTVLVATMIKNKKFQKDQLQAEGYEEIEEIYNRQ